LEQLLFIKALLMGFKIIFQAYKKTTLIKAFKFDAHSTRGVENLIWNSFEDFFFWSNRECELIM